MKLTCSYILLTITGTELSLFTISPVSFNILKIGIEVKDGSFISNVGVKLTLLIPRYNESSILPDMELYNKYCF